MQQHLRETQPITYLSKRKVLSAPLALNLAGSQCNGNGFGVTET